MNMKARVWKENGLWEWDVRDDRKPRMRSTGCAATWRRAMDSALDDLAWLADRGELA